MHALKKEMLLLNSNNVIIKNKALEKMVIMCDMFLNAWFISFDALKYMLNQFEKAWFHISH